ncbi:unnamed protein product [Closterium sp. NIES-53]
MGRPDTRRAQKIQTFAAHTASVKCVSIGRKTGERVITGGDDKKLLLWSTHDREPLLKLSGNTSAIESALLSRSEDQAISGVLSGSVKLWDLNEGKAVRTLTGHRGSALSLDFHPFEPFFASGSQGSTARVWDPRQKEAVHMLMPSTCFSSPAHRPPTTSPLPLPPSPTHPHQPCAR